MLQKLMGWKPGETQLTMDADTVARILPKNRAQGTHRSAARQKKATLTGTQTLDGFWSKPRMNFTRIKAVDEERVDERVRQSQTSPEERPRIRVVIKRDGYLVSQG